MVELQEKACSCCGNGFPPTTDYFTRDRRLSSGLCARCKQCCKRIDAERRATGRKRNVQRTTTHIRRAADYMLKHKHKRVNQMQQLKVAVGCQLCGYDRCARSLHFHHKYDDKDYTVSQMAATKNLSEIVDEIRKCVVLCGNCHGETHDCLHDVSKLRRLDKRVVDGFIHH